MTPMTVDHTTEREGDERKKERMKIAATPKEDDMRKIQWNH